MNGFKYDELVQQALISVVRDVLKDVSKNGLPGNHHFYIRFRTDHPKTKIPKFLKERHPEEVMIVIQYQYWNLDVREKYFSVDLSFNGIRENLIIPYSALTAFVDPSVKFALQFTPSFNDGDDDTPSFRPKNNTSDEKSSDDDGKIISFDSFRKK
ncbi:MAG: hypothetical protein IJT36_06160 [Alphaproteobacteria bacterium]|nr:hypothetical protein [Alphaproteobacteria bacterium]